MGKRLSQMFRKKESVQPVQPFSITILVDPATGNYRWSMAQFGLVPFPLIDKVLEKTRDDFKLQEAVVKAQQELKSRQVPKTAAPSDDKSKSAVPGGLATKNGEAVL